MTRPVNPNILIPSEVAERWGCSERHVRNMVNRGELGHFRLGGKLLRIPLSAVEEVERAIKTERARPLAKPTCTR